MSVKLRLKRFGRRHRSFYRLNAIESRNARNGRVIEQLGWYDPEANDPAKQMSLNRERIEYWLGVGAQPSETVRGLLNRPDVAPAAPAEKPAPAPAEKPAEQATEKPAEQATETPAEQPAETPAEGDREPKPEASAEPKAEAEGDAPDEKAGAGE